MTGPRKPVSTSTLAPAMSPAIPIDVQRAIRRLEDQSNRINTRLDEHAEQLQSKLGSSPSDLLTLAAELRSRFQASGSHPISIAGLAGETAQPQKATAPVYTTLPVAAAMGSLAVAGGKLYRYGGAGWTPFTGSSSGGGTGVIGGGGDTTTGITVLVDTHGARAGYQVSTLSDGSLYFETDRNVFYIAESGVWVFAAGVMVGTLANRPADLGSVDAGFVYAGTDSLTEYEWDGTAWITIALANTVHNGAADPTSGVGNDGDFYLNTTDSVLFGPKAVGAWPGTGVSLIGPQGTKGDTGATGATGATGTPGTDGKTILNGAGAPSNTVGVDGDFYLDTTAEDLYGPKAGGIWPGSGTSLIGPAGPGASPATGSTLGTVQLAGDFSGTATVPEVVGLRGVPVAGTAPTDTYVLTYDGVTSTWEPKAPTGGGGGGSFTVEMNGSVVATSSAGVFIFEINGTVVASFS